MAFISKFPAAAAAATVMFAGAANASVVEAAVTYGTAPSTWVVLISGLALVGLALGGARRSARPAGAAQDARASREPAAATSASSMRFKLPMARSSSTRSSALSRLGPPNGTPARVRYTLAA